jgi:hypothetical protein
MEVATLLLDWFYSATNVSGFQKLKGTCPLQFGFRMFRTCPLTVGFSRTNVLSDGGGNFTSGFVLSATNVAGIGLQKLKGTCLLTVLFARFSKCGF